MGTSIKVDGQELPEVTAIRLDIRVNEPVTVTVTMLAGKEFHFKSEANLVVNYLSTEDERS